MVIYLNLINMINNKVVMAVKFDKKMGKIVNMIIVIKTNIENGFNDGDNENEEINKNIQ